MKQAQTIDEVVDVLLSFSPPDMKGQYSLVRIKELMGLLGDPQEQIPVIHLAGTSGKTSTAYFIRGLLEATSQRTGLTVSPHIVSVNERVQIDGEPLDTEQFVAYVNELLELIRKTTLKPTYFELLVALAYRVFALKKVDYAVVETGLGGLLDGTNVVSRADKVCVITDIGLDHTEILGDTVEEIATQKAGIIQPGNHVIMNRQSPEIMQVIVATVDKQNATLEIVDDDIQAPSILPVFQRRNWVLAMAAFRYIQQRDVLPQIGIQAQNEVATQTPPGRWEMYTYKDKTIILDGAHNPQKLQALCDSLEADKIHSIAVLANLVEAPESKIKAALDVLQPFSTSLIIPEFSAGQDLKSRHSLPADKLAKYATEAKFANVEQQPNPYKAFQILLDRPEKTLLITGSLYLVSIIRPYIQQLNDR
jgi:dihydrofolate synthase/folylpolyglutamate synthase